jgi:hypothetical protein
VSIVRRLLVLALTAAAASAGASAAPAAPPAHARAAGSLQSRVWAVERRVNFLRNRVRLMERSARRFNNWMKCISLVPVSEYGDRDHRFGYHYDERDGTGLDQRPALAVDRRRRGFPDYAFLRFSRRDDCQSDTTRPGTPGAPGTADPASVGTQGSLRSKVRTLERRLKNLDRRKDRLERMSERFDEWESCLSWVTVTEYGDPDGGFGYLFGRKGGPLRYRPALAIDISEWDDPDYMFLAFAGHDRPFVKRECSHEPGESVD